MSGAKRTSLHPSIHCTRPKERDGAIHQDKELNESKQHPAESHRLESAHEHQTIQLDEFESQGLERKSGERRTRLPVEVARTEPERTEPQRQRCRLDRRHGYR